MALLVLLLLQLLPPPSLLLLLLLLLLPPPRLLLLLAGSVVRAAGSAPASSPAPALGWCCFCCSCFCFFCCFCCCFCFCCCNEYRYTGDVHNKSKRRSICVEKSARKWKGLSVPSFYCCASMRQHGKQPKNPSANAGRHRGSAGLGYPLSTGEDQEGAMLRCRR